MAGGSAGTVLNDNVEAFALPVPSLSDEDERRFFKGRALFRDIWVAPPASTTSRDGLGPFFNARSCEGCHVRDGRGHPPQNDTESATSMLIRLSIPNPTPGGAPLPEPNYGGQLQPLANAGITREGDVFVTYTEVEGRYADGTHYSLRRPTYRVEHLGYGAMHPSVMMSPRTAPAMIGLGLLEAIPEADILSHADEADANGDGISGRPNHPTDAVTGQPALGRFGWKANQPSVAQQTAGAFLGDIGITSSLFPTEDCSPAQLTCIDAPTGGEPELDATIFDNVVFYARTLAVPARRSLDDATVQEGEALFAGIGCASCHVTTFRTGAFAPVPEFADQTIHPYTDLLLHDMGADLADDRPDHAATGREWRTAPLWGIGLQSRVNEHTFLLHDGRARSIAEAILWHGGEAEAARERFRHLKASERDALLAFLNSL